MLEFWQQYGPEIVSVLMNALLFVVGLMARHAAKKAGKSVEEVKTSLGIQTGSTLEGAKKNFLEVSNEDAKQVFGEVTEKGQIVFSQNSEESTGDQCTGTEYARRNSVMKFVSDKVYQFQIGVTLQDGVARVLVTNGAEDYDVEALKILKQHLEKTISEKEKVNG